MGTHNVAKIFGSHFVTHPSHICTEIRQCVSLLADASEIPDIHVNHEKKLNFQDDHVDGQIATSRTRWP